MSSPVFDLWSPSVPMPSPETMPDLDTVLHTTPARAVQGEYHYLHEVAICFHKGVLHAGWANGPLIETNETLEVYRGAYSMDRGMTWSAPHVIGPGGAGGEIAHNHGSMFVRDGKLIALVTRWEERKPLVEIYTLGDRPDQWQSQGIAMRGFIPFNPPVRLANGDWVIGGEIDWTTPAVAVSRGDSLTDWTVIPIPRADGLSGKYPEVSVARLKDDTLLGVARTNLGFLHVTTGSADGRSWTPLVPSNFPGADSKPYITTLSDGRHLLLSNIAPLKRTLLAIAVTEPGGRHFCKIWKLRHCAYPVNRVLHPGREMQWSYPWAIEHEGSLYIGYTCGKEDAGVSVIPLSTLV